MRRTHVFLSLAAAVAFGSYTNLASAATVYTNEEKGTTVNAGVLIQPWAQLTAPGSSGAGSSGIGAPDGSSPSLDFYLRRARLMLYGTVDHNLSYFIETDQPDFGKGGVFTSSMFVQDAFLSYKFVPEFSIDAGMMLLPFSHHTIEGAVGLNAMDYHAQMIRYPTSKILRDFGVQFRGLVFDDLLYYRVGVFEGVRQVGVLAAVPAGQQPPTIRLNDSGLPRITGQLRLNILGAESDFFLKGIYFSKQPLLSVGVGADYQNKAVVKPNGQPGDYIALSGDVFAELPLSEDDEIIAKGNVFYYGQGSSPLASAAATGALARGGASFFVEAGFRHTWFEPLAFIEYLKGRDGTIEIISPHAGVNFWISKHTFNLKADVGYRQTDTLQASGATLRNKDILGTLQGQVFF